jgi:ubiquinone/menaquinone biosynthesis C-methylase UbiE
MNVQDRVTEMRLVPADQLIANPANWRRHPQAQQRALAAVLDEVGFAGAVIAREDEDGGLVIIDGHARAEMVGEATVPVLVTDLTEAEADVVLATYDPIGAMAETNSEAFAALSARINTGNEALLDVLAATREFKHVANAVDSEWAVDTTQGDTAEDHVGYDLGSVWPRTGKAEAKVKDYLLPLPSNDNNVKDFHTNYSRSPAQEMERIVRTYMRPNDRFLEVCAGWFTFSTTAAIQGYDGEGVDIWETSLAFGRKQRAALPEQAGSFKVVEGNALQLPYEADQFDFVYCNPPFFNLERYSGSPDDLAASNDLAVWLTQSGRMMAEMKRVAKPNALICTVMADYRKDGVLVPMHTYWIEEAARRGLVMHDLAVQHMVSQTLRFWRFAFDDRRTAKAHEYIITFKSASG